MSLSLSPLCSGNSLSNHICITDSLRQSSSPVATRMSITDIFPEGADSGAIQTAAQILRCRPPCEGEQLTSFNQQKNTPSAQCSFSQTSSRDVTETHHEAEPEI